ncbi:hypothetical protein FB567DRAFT_77941 [Paraphoma chrysanthemicola]|uniref:Uncharacterized protein n=1 Tax=Paraphoma chrysanthemicola TaxID=798071 RepID=A0A8K0R4J5_9PLEO|nr:hypothetical protein FB567DRAFT_77941 [Paraphoma chrysanthemicola]
MSYQMTYSFYGTTIPVFKRINNSAINTLTVAQTEIANGLPISEQELLDASIGDMLPLRTQPGLLARFQAVPLEALKLTSAPIPAMDSGYTSLAEMVDFFKAMNEVLDAVDEKAFNESAEKQFEVQIAGKMLKISGLADYLYGYVVPNSFFHLNVIYMLLRSKGFKLGKRVYTSSWMSEQLTADFAPLRAPA